MSQNEGNEIYKENFNIERSQCFTFNTSCSTAWNQLSSNFNLKNNRQFSSYPDSFWWKFVKTVQRENFGIEHFRLDSLD